MRAGIMPAECVRGLKMAFLGDSRCTELTGRGGGTEPIGVVKVLGEGRVKGSKGTHYAEVRKGGM